MELQWLWVICTNCVLSGKSVHWRKPFLPSTTIFTSSGQSCMLWHSSIWLLAVFCLQYICYLIWQAQKRVIAFLTCNFNSANVLTQIHRFDLCLFQSAALLRTTFPHPRCTFFVLFCSGLLDCTKFNDMTFYECCWGLASFWILVFSLFTSFLCASKYLNAVFLQTQQGWHHAGSNPSLQIS